MPLEEQENLVDAVKLRAELKQWETDFRLAHNGCKPSRDDIKNDSIIAAKYKQYSHVTKKSDAPANSSVLTATPTKTTRYLESRAGTQQRSRHTVATTPKRTPSRRGDTTSQPSYLSPVQEVIPTPAFIRNALGPTPQKDGQVLGIFDIISGGTPSNREKTTTRDADTVIAGTPSRSTQAASESHFSRTPQSAGKRYFLDSFAGTPLKRKRDDDLHTTSASKHKFATPSFLRRSFPLAPITEDNTDTTSVPAPFRKRGLVRSLSSIIQGLRKQENQEADEEWDILNEIEEEDEEPRSKKVSQTHVDNSQNGVEMRLGPDQGHESDGSASPNGEPGMIRKPWKKKGLKRQTRRVIMRPVLHKTQKVDDDDNASEDEDVNEKDPSGDLNPEDGEDHRQRPFSEQDSAKARKASKTTAPAKEAKKPGRKINPDAHTNFRKLNIKNKNSKANGRGRKFGRR